MAPVSASIDTPRPADEVAQLSSRAFLALANGELALAEQLLLERGAYLLARHGPLHASYAENIAQQATVCRAAERYVEAKDLLLHALDILTHAKGSQIPLYLSVFCQLAAVYLNLGDDAAAENAYLAVLSEQKSLPDQPMPAAQTLSHLAWLYASRASIEQSLSAMRESQHYLGRATLKLLDNRPEAAQRECLKDMLVSTDLFMSIGLRYFPKTHDVVSALWAIVLPSKGMAMECSLAKRLAQAEKSAHSSEVQRKALMRLRADLAKKFLGQYRTVKDSSALYQALHDQGAELRELEATISHKSADDIACEPSFVLDDTSKLARAIPPDSVLVEFVKYRRYTFPSASACLPQPGKDFSYAAFVMRSGEPQSAQMLDLGDAAVIEDLLNAHLRVLTPSPSRSTRGLAFDEHEPIPQEDVPGEALKRLIFDPLLPHLAGCARLILITDGELSRLSMITLPLAETGGYLLDRYCIRHAGSAQEILSSNTVATAESTQAVVIATLQSEPKKYKMTFLKRLKARMTWKLGGQRETMHALSPDLEFQTRPDANPLNFSSLPGTHLEGKYVARKLGARLWQGVSPLDAALDQLLSPRVLHVATHGLLLPKVRSPFAGGQPGIEQAWLPPPDNPMMRSGLALAGTNGLARADGASVESKEAWLTAEEIALMNLRGTQLVVLSGCETGLGETSLGNGVVGMRRAFMLAGAQNLIMSLWKVDDVATTLLMVRIYENLIDHGLPMDEALRNAQQQLRRLTVAQLSSLWQELDGSNSCSSTNRSAIASYLDGPPTHRPFECPFYWGAFIISGQSATLSPN